MNKKTVATTIIGTNEPCQDEVVTSGRRRRRAIKSLSAGGLLATAGFFPKKWTTPIIDSVLLPAHAQSSPTCPCEGLNIGLNWEIESESCINLDLEVLTPGGTHIGTRRITMGDCLKHNGDDQCEEPTPRTAQETVSCAGAVSPGHYSVFVRARDNPVRKEPPKSVAVAVTGCGNDTETIVSYPAVASSYPNELLVVEFDVCG